jgi:hypothetical protein
MYNFIHFFSPPTQLNNKSIYLHNYKIYIKVSCKKALQIYYYLRVSQSVSCLERDKLWIDPLQRHLFSHFTISFIKIFRKFFLIDNHF